MQAAETKTLSRRRWLLASVAFGAIALTSSGVALVRTGGYEVDEARTGKLIALLPWEFLVVDHIASRMVAPDLPGDPAIVSARDAKVAEFIDGYLVGMSKSMRGDLLKMIGYIEHLAPLALGYAHRFTKLDEGAQDEVLASLQSSRLSLLRAGFEGMKSLVMMGYYRDPRAFRLLGYRGPWLEVLP